MKLTVKEHSHLRESSKTCSMIFCGFEHVEVVEAETLQ